MSGDPYIKENERLEAEIARLQQHRELDRIDRERLQECLSDRIARLRAALVIARWMPVSPAYTPGRCGARQGGEMRLDLSEDEINLLLSAVGLALNVITDPKARTQLEALQTKLMAARDRQ